MFKKVMASFVIILIAFAVTISINIFLEFDYSWTIPEENKYDTTLKVVCGYGLEPMSFIDENGNETGYNVDYIYRIGEKLGVNIDIDLMTWSQAISSFQDGNYDLIIGVCNNATMDDWVTCSHAILSEEFTVFYNKNKKFQFNDLYNSTIALQDDSVFKYLIENYYNFEAELVYHPSVDEAIFSLHSGTSDYVIAPKNVGEVLIKKHNYNNVEDSNLIIYNAQYSIGVHPENKALISKINDAIISLNNDGIVVEMYGYWFGKYIGKGTLKLSIIESSEVLLLVFLVSLIIITFIVFIYEGKRNELIKFFAYKDLMTGFKNRSTYEEEIQYINLQIMNKKMTPFGIFMFDLNGLKQINDNLGHKVGDNYIKKAAEIIKFTFEDFELYRIGGDEFIALSTEKQIKYYDELTKKLIANIKTFNATQDEFPGGLSIAFGKAIYDKDNDRMYIDVYNKADEDMYYHKNRTKMKKKKTSSD